MAPFAQNIIGILALAAVLSFGAASSATTAATVSTTTASTTVSCYACGQYSVDPEADSPGSFCNFDQNTKCNATYQKMYNMTCDIMDRMGASSKWVRQCPVGVKSCFYAVGTYGVQTAVFRGCAGAPYPYDELCSRELQAVTVVAGTQSVDVQVQLCYCNQNNCNQKITGGADRAGLAGVTALAASVLALAAGSFRRM